MAGRVFGLALLFIVFAGAGFLLTCQKNPNNTTSHYAPQQPMQEHSAVPTHHRQRRAEQPAQTAGKPKEQPADTTASAPDPAPQESQSTEQPAEGKSSPSSNTSIETPRTGGKRPAVVHTGLGEVSRGDPTSTQIAVTFDAGADSRPASKILDVLAKHGDHATFFLTGKWIEKNPALARRIVAEGHEIGNHTYSHRRLTQLSSGDIAEEVDRTEQIALQVTGRSTKPYLRVPYGSRDRRVLGILQDLGYRSIYWDLDCWDSVKKGITSAQIEDRVLSKVRNGSIVLMHCGSQQTADALDDLLSNLESKGYRQVKVSDLLGS